MTCLGCVTRDLGSKMVPKRVQYGLFEGWQPWNLGSRGSEPQDLRVPDVQTPEIQSLKCPDLEYLTSSSRS